MIPEDAIWILELIRNRDARTEAEKDAANAAIEALKAQLSQEGKTSTQPEPQEGYWIPHETPDGGEQYECSRCGVLWEFNDGTPEDNEAYFCPKCGKKLITK